MPHTALSFFDIAKLNKSDADIDKFNPYHDRLGRFATGGGGASFSGTLLHGSPHKGIKEFDISRAGSNTGSGEKLLFFTNDKQMADDFSYERLPGSTKFVNVRGKKGEVYRTKVKMKKPLDLRNLSDDDIKAVKELDAEGILSDSDIKTLAGMKNHGSLKAALDLRPETLSRLGYDGLIANAGNGRTEFAVIDSKQTKIIHKTFSEVLKNGNTSVSLVERWQNDTNPFKILDGLEEIEKFNPYHDRLGRFTTGGGASSFTWKPGASAAHDSAIAREKERASSGTSAGGSKDDTRASERGHIKPKSYEENIETVKQELGCDDKQAKKYMRSMLSYTAENYEAIRAYQSGKKNAYTKKFSNDAKNIEEYIDKAPHWNGGTLYRGVGLDASVDVKSAFKPGTELNMQGTSSWSSDTGIAKNFARDRNMVIFQCDRISKATSVSHISNNPGEKEVLVSKDTKYVAKKVSKRGRYYYVYLDEVTATSKSYSGAAAKSFSDIMKFNPNHDEKGRFSSGGGTGVAVASAPVSLSKDNEEYLRSYTAGQYDAACQISQEIAETGDCKNYIDKVKNSVLTVDGKQLTSTAYDNLNKNIEQTKQIMKSIDSQPVKSDTLVRVETGDKEYQAGDTITWGLRSTSRDTSFGEKVYNNSDEGLEDKLYNSSGKYLGMTEFRIVGDKKSLDISKYSEYDQQESLVKGNFKVLSVKKAQYTPPQPKTFEQATKDNPSLKDRYTEFTSKKGNLTIRDNETGQTYPKRKFDSMVYHNGKMMEKYEFDSLANESKRNFRGRTIVEIEQA